MFQFPGFASICMDIPINRDGLPHSDTRGSTLLCSSPRIFAAWHVLHRHCMPRHPPYALFYFVLAWLAQGVPAPIQSTLAYMSSICYLDLKKITVHAHAYTFSYIYYHYVKELRRQPQRASAVARCQGTEPRSSPLPKKKRQPLYTLKSINFLLLLPPRGATGIRTRGALLRKINALFCATPTIA